MYPRSTLVGAFVACILGVDALAQESNRPTGLPTSAIRGLVTDDGGAVIEGAFVQFVPDAFPDIPALQELSAPCATEETATDARGMFRIHSDRPGLLLVTTKAGLGALELRCWPNRAVRLRLRPMGELRVEVEGELEWHFACASREDAGFDRRRLPMQVGQSVRLPDGTYEVFWRLDSTIAWQSVRMREGQLTTLPMPTEGVEMRGQTSPLFPAGFPELTLRDRPATLLGDARKARWIGDAYDTALLSADRGLDATEVRLRIEGAPERATLVTLLGAANGSYSVFAVSNVVDGAASLRTPTTSGDDWALLTAPGYPAIAMPRMQARDLGAIAWQAGRSVNVHATDATGAPHAARAVVFRPAIDGPATARSFTDELGNAKLGPIAGAGVVCIEGEDHEPFSVAIDATDAAPIDARLERGLSVVGTARFDDGSPAARVAVSLRDPSGRMRPATRTCVTDENGAFVFSGLAAGSRLIAFASTTRKDRTFSGRAQTHAEAAEITLVLADEDPTLRPPR